MKHSLSAAVVGHRMCRQQWRQRAITSTLGRLVAIVVFAVPVVALADKTSGVMASWQATLLTIVVSTLGTALAACVGVLVRILAKKYGIEVTEREQRLLDEAVRQGVAYAEEYARKAAVSGAAPVAGEKKMEVAAGFVAARAAALRLPAPNGVLKEAVVEAKLQDVRTKGE